MKPLIFVLLIPIMLVSCEQMEKHFLSDKNYRQQVHRQFVQRKKDAAGRSQALFAVFEREHLSLQQREALEFLYAYMPLSDLADYSGDFFLQHIDAALAARDYFAWGKTIPEDIFRHFVLVYRVNNENCDTARMVFFEALKERVKHLSMYDAALEVNHWCHEKVTYRGTDARTSSPLALVRTSWGRCGEESTLTAMAMRSVGIPARQCYTPRWAHTDDNHAWVEVWIDGKWHYMGACEPEPELDVAWFTAPAARAMMVHTNVFGCYNGTEEKNWETPLYSKINLLSHYAATREVQVQVIDSNNLPVEGAKVQFKVYNYAEFYPIATAMTNKQGRASIRSGKGDLLIWANKGDSYGSQKSSVQDDVTIVKLDGKYGWTGEKKFVVNVPPEQAVQAIAKDKVALNNVRFAYEDSLRNAYMQTFIGEQQARAWAQQNHLNAHSTWKYLNKAQGNWQEIQNFILHEKNNPHLFEFLATLTDKDLRDTPARYLTSYWRNAAPPQDTALLQKFADIVIPYIASPRIEQELIRSWSNFFDAHNGKGIPTMQSATACIDYVKNNIKINDDENYYNCRISPQGVLKLQMADRISRNIFFVALCRRAGIAARIEPATYYPQYFENGKWQNVIFEAETPPALSKTKLTVNNAADNLVQPGYYQHYTLAYFKDGDFHTLDYEDNVAVKKFPYTLDLDEGYYRLTTGSRANDGSVSVSTQYFELKKDAPHHITVQLPATEGKLFVKGIVDMNTIVALHNNAQATLKELANDKGLMLCFVDLGKEPSQHILQDMSLVRLAMELWGGGILLLPSRTKALDMAAFTALPQQTTWGAGTNRHLLTTAASALQIDFQNNFPFTLYLSRNGGILYSSVGYQIGIGETILKIIEQEKGNSK
ncbi:transglutaminase [Bacteroidia bacterium]|nr:transglutaminase [Bacteroidia bacterium]